MNKALRALLVSLVGVICALPGAVLAEDAKVTPDMEALIRRLEESGALDAAIDRGIERHIRRQMEARQKLEEEQKRVKAEAARNARPVDRRRDRMSGMPEADVTLIVYTDLECPFCKRFDGVPEQAIAKFEGKANLAFRHFPLEFHGETAKRASYYAECVGRQAGSKGFFVFVSEWFRLTTSNGKGLEGGDAQIRGIAKSAGANDLAALELCARDPAVAKLIQDDIADGVRSGIAGTPGLIVRNNRTGASIPIMGGVPVQQIEQMIERALGG